MNIKKMLKSLMARKSDPQLDQTKAKEFQDGFRRATHKISALSFDKSKFNKAQAQKWAKLNNFHGDLEETKKSLNIVRKGHYVNKRVILLTSGVKATVAVNKSSPTSSEVHVPTAGTEDKITIKTKDGTEISVGKGEHDPANLKELRESFNRFMDEEGIEKEDEEIPGFDDAQDLMRAKGADLVTLPDDVEGTNCANCLWVQGDECTNPKVAQSLPDGAARMCCALWDAPGVKRAWEDVNKSRVAKGEPRRIAKVAILFQNKILIGQRRDNNKWTLPGGHVDPNETMKEGALREALEETGLELDPKFIFPLTEVCQFNDSQGLPIQVQGWMIELEDQAKTTMTNDPDGEVKRWRWMETSEGLPVEITDNLQAHQNKDVVLQALGLVQKSINVDGDPAMLPGIDNLEGGLLKSADVPDLNNQQELVRGIDYELYHGYTKMDEAQGAAQLNLSQDKNYYKKLELGDEGVEDLIDNNAVNKDTSEAETDPLANLGYNIDLGSGASREPGHLGFDLYPYDHGTVVHDLNLGIPLEDGSVRKAQAINSFHTMDLEDPKALLSEIHRVLMPGGQFTYEGPNEIYNYPEWTQDYPGLVLTNHESVEKADGKDAAVRQEFTRVAIPDPSTANDAEPRIGVSQEDDLPADALTAADTLDYAWSDATSSGKGNRLHGYPSQGALVDKGGPGSGPSGGGNGQHMSQEQKLRLIREQQTKLQAAGKSLVDKCMETMKSYRMPDTAEPDVTKDFVAMSERPTAKNDTRVEKILKSERIVPILKASKHKQIVYGVVIEPDTIDAQDDVMEAHEIEAAAHRYLTKSRVVGGEHSKPIMAEPLESFIAPQDFEMTGQNGPQLVKKGSWVLGVRINDPKEWQKVLDGDYTGFSVGGLGARQVQ